MLRRDFLRLGAIPLRPSGEKRARSCILINLVGGPSHLDTWDMKPDAPRDIRGPFRPIKTNVAGIEISEIFPRMARHAEKYAIIRSVHTEAPVTHGVVSHGVSRTFPASQSFARQCAQAVQLAQSGAGLIEIDMFETVFDQPTWDAHGWKPFSSLSCYRRVVGPMFDQAYSKLLEDLSGRGLLASTLVVAAGEFGRTPKINPSGGRDHWPHCWTILMAGGGIKGGRIYGSSDRIGAEPKDNPVTLAMIQATIEKAMGIQPKQSGAEPIDDLFS